MLLFPRHVGVGVGVGVVVVRVLVAVAVAARRADCWADTRDAPLAERRADPDEQRRAWLGQQRFLSSMGGQKRAEATDFAQVGKEGRDALQRANDERAKKAKVAFGNSHCASGGPS